MDDLEKLLKEKGMKFDDEGKAWVRRTYRRRPIDEVMGEVEDKVKDSYGEHQLKIETVQMMQDELDDLSGANKPIEVKIFGPDHLQLRSIAKEVAEKLEARGKGRGLKEVNSNVREGNPDLMIDLDTYELTRLGLDRTAVARQLKTIFTGRRGRWRCRNRRSASPACASAIPTRNDSASAALTDNSCSTSRSSCPRPRARRPAPRPHCRATGRCPRC